MCLEASVFQGIFRKSQSSATHLFSERISRKTNLGQVKDAFSKLGHVLFFYVWCLSHCVHNECAEVYALGVAAIVLKD